MRAGLVATLCLVAVSAVSERAHGEARCPGIFLDGRMPTLGGLYGDGIVLCNADYAAMDSAISRGPIWSAELLTEENLEVASHTPRTGTFYADPRLPPGSRGELVDWRRSGFDRGHLTPSGDEPGAEAQEQSFALSNVVPQAAGLNRGAWEGIESAVRGLTDQDGQIYVVTGVLFPDRDIQRIGPDGVYVPSGTWKAIYDPVAEGAAVYVCSNVERPDCRMASLATLRQWAGIDVFPTLPEDVKRRIMPMPAIGKSPYAQEVRNAQSRPGRFDWDDRRVKVVLHMLQDALQRGR